MGSYPGKWAAVSGYVERLPLLQAYREISEETGLRQDAVRLRGIGVPLPVEDVAEHRSWLVFPFLFEVAPKAKIRPSWESAEARWFSPDDLANLDTVPCLSQALAAVWPRFGARAFWRRVEKIATDCERGATELAKDALGTLMWLLNRPTRDWREGLTRGARALGAARHSMGVIPHLMAKVAGSVASGAKAPLGARRATGRMVEELERTAARTARQAAQAIRGRRRIFTLSYSSVCRDALLLWARRTLRGEVVVAESRPRCEGVRLAKALSDAGVRVQLITDAQMGAFAGQCDALLVGADGITADNLLVNKAGTRLAVLAAREAGVPAYAVCQKCKVFPPGWPVVNEEQEPENVADAKQFRVRNVVFDHTPLAWFTAVICEDGPLTPKMLRGVRASLEAADVGHQCCASGRAAGR